jgi:GNAT superfamily N-acetyltransferase
MPDPRIAPVEDNLESFASVLNDSGRFRRSPDTDVTALYSDLPFPLFNAIVGARFASGTVEQRARDVVAPYLERGLPFLWWTTPSGHADELRPVLTELGMVEEPTPGMYVDLNPVDLRLPDGVDVVTVDSLNMPDILKVFLDGFGFPETLFDDFRVLIEAFFRLGGLHVLAFDHDRPVAGGSAWLTGPTAGLYNISTLEEARGRGLGNAVTAALMNLARDHGATQAILHSSEMGRSVYERLGFVEVCRVPQFVWVPSGDGPPAETTVV